MNLIKKILLQEELINEPPIVIDLGASGETLKEWRKISHYSHCIAFDADEREMAYIKKESKNWKKLNVVNKVISLENSTSTNFYLTSSPFCSSILEPDQELLSDWAFKDLFNFFESKIMSSTTLLTVLEKLGVNRIDWLKLDTQGIDLRILKSLDINFIEKILVIDSEPGIIGAYKCEDKLHSLLAYFEGLPFWISDMIIKGSQRINIDYLKKRIGTKNSKHTGLLYKKVLPYFLKTSPGWSELTFMNTMKDIRDFRKRDVLLMCLFGLLKKQFGFVQHISVKASAIWKDEVFNDISLYCEKKFHTGLLKLSINALDKFLVLVKK